ncbi:MAG: LysR family transcriptional regulator [Verrucomicrobia bacterium]|nr:LysR family transcriptional regulator [Verrucomicrobiota bacterium]
MHIKTLRLFLDLAESGSFSKAGDANQISQSAVSQRIMRLEEKLGVKLLVRGGRSEIELTEEGKVFFCGCEDILERYERVLDELLACNGKMTGAIRVLAEPCLTRFWLPKRLTAFLLRHPEVQVHVESAAFEAVYSRVLAGEAEIGLVAYPLERSGVAIEPLPSEELALLASGNFRAAERDSWALSDLAGERFVAFASNEEMLADIRRQFAGHGVPFAPAESFDKVDSVRRAVQEGGGITLLPALAVAEYLSSGELVQLPLKTRLNPRPIGAVRRSIASSSALSRAFLGCLQETKSENHL